MQHSNLLTIRIDTELHRRVLLPPLVLQKAGLLQLKGEQDRIAVLPTLAPTWLDVTSYQTPSILMKMQ